MQVLVFIMSCCSKEKMERNNYNNTCKSHSAKSDREIYRICPSKLSKKELEDLYFTLLENNLELKKTINGQQDKIRVLSTQVQRITNTHGKMMAKETKECCTTKAFVNEQKDFITELKETNQRMAERIQQLNMRLCSAKQFSKTSPPQTSNARSFRFASASLPKKHNCLTKDQDNEQVLKLSTSSQWEDRHNSGTKDQDNEQVLKLSTSSQWEDRNPRESTQTPTQITVPLEKKPPKSDQTCDENKCKSLMEELKIKIVALQEELFNVHDEYSTRIGRLETEVSVVRKENIRVCSERSASEHELQTTVKRTSDVMAKYRLSEAKRSELSTELAIEKRKVAELETQLKAANMSGKINKTIDDHLTTIQETNEAPDDCLLKCYCGSPAPHLPPQVMNEKAPTKTLPLVSPPKRKGSEVLPIKTKYSPSKDSSSTSQQVSKSSPTKTISEETNCETCGCKPQLPSDPVPVHSPAPVDTLPLVSPPTRKGSEVLPIKTKYSPSKDSSSTSQQVSKSSPTKTISEETNCETCGCKPQLPSDPVPVHSPAPVDTLPLVSPPKRKDSEVLPIKTKYSPSKDSSSTSQQVSKSSPTKTISEETNCETCGCKPQLPSDPVPVHSPAPVDETNFVTCYKAQLTSDPVHSPTPADNCKCHECECLPPQDLSTQSKDIQCDLCDCGPPKNTSTPLKAKKKDVECCCPGWVNAVILKSPTAQTQDENAKCKECCFNDKNVTTESPSSKNGKILSPRGATIRWSPTKHEDSTKSSKTGDDSGYQDTDELVLLKQNKELMTKILELQNQVDRMKIRMCEMSEAKPGNISESTGNPKKTRDYVVATVAVPLLGALKKVSELPEVVPARLSSVDNTSTTTINSPPLRREFAQENIPAEQIEYNKSIEGENYESTKLVPFPHKVSDECVREPGKVLSIEILGNSEEAVRNRNWDDTRAKTIEEADGTLQISEEASYKFRPLDLINDDYRKRYKTDTSKLKIIEKKKLEISGSHKPESGNVSLKSATSDVSGHRFNPEKLKYWEAEGIISMPELGEIMTKSNEVSSSLTESVPSNPELGFGIPRLASKNSQDKYKAKSDSGQFKKSPAAGSSSPDQARDGLMEVKHGMLKLPMTEALVANNPTAPKQTDQTKKKKEDCEDCAACSFDKECELKHKNATNHRINKHAPEMQKKQSKKHDQHNSLQIPGPAPTSDNRKREKMRNLFSHLKKDRSSKQNREDFVVNPKINGKQTTATTDGPANLPDGPLLDKRQHIGTDYINIDTNIFTHDKKDKSITQKKESHTKEDLIVNPKIYEQNTYAQTDGPISLPDVSFLDEREDSKNAVEKKQSRIVFNINDDLDPPLFEVKMPTEQPRSERMLPTLMGPTNWRGKATQVEPKADVAQITDQKLAEKSCQAATNIADSAYHQHYVAPYRRRSGSVCYRTVPVSPDPPVCNCTGQQDGYCTDKPWTKGKQAHNIEDVKATRDQCRPILTSDCGTYTVNSKQTGTSPDNTDLEMSYLSDLPMEKEKKTSFMSRPLSPGEDRTTTFTNTHSYYSPPTSYMLSEGEMPATTSKPEHSEPDNRLYLDAAPPPKLETLPVQQMKAALQTISEELQRCRGMILTHRPAEQSQRSSQTSPEITPPIALRPGVATQGIGDTYAPMSVFTLHIGTIVMSDEAVLNSFNKNLALKWKFYDQAVTMVRMHVGRVIVFDFSTEYDIKITDDFLHYLKHEEMPIVICELDQEEVPFATCALPLRDALLHTNSRADMSLALMAGPEFLKERAKNVELGTLDTGDEVGVIDLWCLMRADANMLPGINLAIAQPKAAPMTAEQRHAGVMPQMLDDYNELDLAMSNTEHFAPLNPNGRNQTYGDVEYNRTSNEWSSLPSGRRKDGTESETTQTYSYDARKYPPIRDRKLLAPNASSMALFAPPKRKHSLREKQSELIINEVNPKIKSSGDVKHALERSNRLNDSKARSNRSEDISSQAQISYNSLKSVLSRLQKRGSRTITQTHGGEQRSFIKKLRTVSANKIEPSKKVTILPKYVQTKFDKSIEDVSQEQTENENKKRNVPKLEITVLWLALNEECEAMIDPYVQQVFVAYSFLGRSGAELETPVSLPKPRHYVDKCYFNFRKVFELSSSDLPKLGHMARCHASGPAIENEEDCIIFSVVSEPVDDPLGLETCKDIGYAYLYLGDLLEYSSGSPGYTEVTPVQAARRPDFVCGVLAVRFDGLDVVRRSLLLTPNDIAGHST